MKNAKQQIRPERHVPLPQQIAELREENAKLVAGQAEIKGMLQALIMQGAAQAEAKKAESQANLPITAARLPMPETTGYPG